MAETTIERVRGGRKLPGRSPEFSWFPEDRPRPEERPKFREIISDRTPVSERLRSWPRLPDEGQPFGKDVVVRTSVTIGARLYHNGRIGTVVPASSPYWKEYGVSLTSGNTIALFLPDKKPVVIEKSLLVLNKKYGREK